MSNLRGRLARVLAVVSLLLVGWVLVMPHLGTKAEPPRDPKRSRDQFAGDRVPPPPASSVVVKFDGERAMGYLRTLCTIGPRISGSEGMAKQRVVLKEHFEPLGGKVEFQRFTAAQRSQFRPVELANVIVTWHPERERRVILCCHYDTRPHADQEPNRSKWTEPFVSANDGTAGVAWLMELGHHMKDIPATVGVDFVIFDGEEYVFDEDPKYPKDKYFLGSDYFAAEYKRVPPKHQYVAAVLLDMAAGRNPSFPIERNSFFKAQTLAKQVWAIAAEQGIRSFKPEIGYEVNDDHLALNRVGIPAIDIIDFDYPHWHRLSDRPENCSGQTMEEVAKVLTVWLQRVR